MVEGKITNAYAQRTTYFDLLQAEGTSSEIRSKLSIDLLDENAKTVYSNNFATGLQGEWGPVNAGRLEKINHQNLTIILKTHNTKQILDKVVFPWKGFPNTKPVTILQNKMQKTTDTYIQSYEILKNLEEKIRNFIETELSEYNPKWWKQLIPGDVKENAESRKKEDEERKTWDFKEQHLISYIDFTDYEKIITQKNNWKEIFKYVFRDVDAISAKLKEIEPIRNAISHTRNLDKYEEKQLGFYSEEILRAISYYYDNKEKIKKQKAAEKIEKELPTVPIAVSFDRTVYPTASKVYIRANVPEIIVGKPIVFQVYNSKNKLLLTKQIDPQKYEDQELKSHGLFETSFVMEEDEWKAGEKFSVKVIHGSSEAFDETIIDVRNPVVQTDKSVYMINSDMIVTVIDPDSDKDSRSAEYVGDRENSKLIIESKYGKIDGYKLRETGDSTAIFQGIIGILGIRKDGSVIERKIDGKTINKIQGTGIADGFIGGPPGEKIKITYKSSSGTASVVVFVSNFGAVVELDQKIYKSTDKVNITIVAPDLVFDFDSITEIGNSPESMIRIQTSKDELLNYKLVETGPGTAIFIGEISLTESLQKSSNKLQATVFGPTDGIIACDNDDFIQVSISCFGNETVGRALIKP